MGAHTESAYYIHLPYSRHQSDEQTVKIASKVLELFNIKGSVEIIQCNSKEALILEQNFRHSWWLNQSDIWRHTMHDCGMLAYDVVEKYPKYKGIHHDGWQKAENLSKSNECRIHFNRLLETEIGITRDYLQVFFRVSQQILSRSLRWEAIFPQLNLSAYALLYELVTYKILPLGFYDGKFYLQKLNPKARYQKKTVPFFSFRVKNKCHNKVFLCYEFKNNDFKLLKKLLMDQEYDIQHGPVNERTAPIEHQLGNEILQSSCVVAIVKAVDKDFGLPIWILQEIDLAIKHKIPVLLFTTSIHSFYLSDTIEIVNYRPGHLDDIKVGLAKLNCLH